MLENLQPVTTTLIRKSIDYTRGYEDAMFAAQTSLIKDMNKAIADPTRNSNDIKNLVDCYERMTKFMKVGRDGNQ